MDSKPFRTTRRLANLRAGRNDWYRITNAAGAGIPAQVMIYDEIGYFGVTAQDFAADLRAITGDIEVHLNCPGGDVFDGIAIYNTLKPRGPAVFVDGIAASAASFIAQAAAPGRLFIARNASIMIHDAFAMGIGNASDLREFADLLDVQSENIASIYAERSGRPADFWRQQMVAESWYVGQAAVDAGLADALSGESAGAGKLAATFDLSVFRNAKYSTDDRKKMASAGQAMPDGSYPIADAEDLDNAIHAVGRGGADHDAIRRHIIKRAAALGLSSKIPDNWGADGSLKPDTDDSTSNSADTSWLIDALKGAK